MDRSVGSSARGSPSLKMSPVSARGDVTSTVDLGADVYQFRGEKIGGHGVRVCGQTETGRVNLLVAVPFYKGSCDVYQAPER